MSSIAFAFGASPETNDHEVRPEVNGMDILPELEAEALGIDPPEFFAQAELERGGQLLIGRCGCGVVGCADVHIEVSLTDGGYLWHLDSDREYSFESDQYLASVNVAVAYKGWEPIERTAERLVSAIDFTSLAESGYQFEWASARIAKGRITLSFSKAQTQRLFEVGWDAQSPDDAVRQVSRWAANYV